MELAKWETKIIEFGTGYSVVIPAEVISKLAIGKGDILELSIGRIVERK